MDVSQGPRPGPSAQAGLIATPSVPVDVAGLDRAGHASVELVLEHARPRRQRAGALPGSPTSSNSPSPVWIVSVPVPDQRLRAGARRGATQMCAGSAGGNGNGTARAGSSAARSGISLDVPLRRVTSTNAAVRAAGPFCTAETIAGTRCGRSSKPTSTSRRSMISRSSRSRTSAARPIPREKQEDPRVNGGLLWRYRWDLNPSLRVRAFTGAPRSPDSWGSCRRVGPVGAVPGQVVVHQIAPQRCWGTPAPESGAETQHPPPDGRRIAPRHRDCLRTTYVRQMVSAACDRDDSYAGGPATETSRKRPPFRIWMRDGDDRRGVAMDGAPG